MQDGAGHPCQENSARLPQLPATRAADGRGVDRGNAHDRRDFASGAHRDELYLVYTRRGANNDHVFRNRAPPFIAQVDTDRACVIRQTERIAIPGDKKPFVDTAALLRNNRPNISSSKIHKNFDCTAAGGSYDRVMSSMVRVAREANVAISTVSLALNHRDRVKPETLQRIEEAMRRVGYRPRRKAPGDGTARSQRPMRAAFIYTLESLNLAVEPSMSSYAREIISGMQSSLAGTSSSLSIFRGVDHVDNDPIVNEQLNGNEFDGVILFGPEAHSGYLQRLQRSGLPLVVLNRLPEHGRYSCVTLDYYGGAQQAIAHLAGLGHQRIGLLLEDETAKWSLRELADGARDALAERGLTAALEHVGPELRSAELLERLCRELLDAKATAIFTGDHLAVRCIDVLERLGVRVPDDVSIIGFDDRGLTSGSGLALTTIGYDKQRMGRMAIRMLQQLAQSRGKLRWLAGAVSTRLVKGQTTASSPSAGANGA